MDRNRSMIAGGTDYTGYPIEDIMRHLTDWSDETRGSVSKLKALRAEAAESAHLLENPPEVLRHCDRFVDMFDRFSSDFDRLLEGIPRGVRANHIEIIKQIYDGSRELDDECIEFKNNWVYKSLPHEEMRRLLDSIYQTSRQQVIDYRDLSNLNYRLKTFVE